MHGKFFCAGALREKIKTANFQDALYENSIPGGCKMNWFYDLKIARKLIVTFLAVIVLVGGLGFYAINRTGQGKSGIDQHRDQLAAEHPGVVADRIAPGAGSQL